MISQSLTAFLCSRHPKLPHANGYYREIVMKECKVTYPDKLDPKKEIVEEYLMCPRCYQTVPITQDMRMILDVHKHGGTAETVRVNKSTIIGSTSTPITA